MAWGPRPPSTRRPRRTAGAETRARALRRRPGTGGGGDGSCRSCGVSRWRGGGRARPVEDELPLPVEAVDPNEVGQPAPGVRAFEDRDPVDRLRHEVALRGDVRALG